MKYTKSKCVMSFCVLLLVLYGMGLLNIFIQKKGRKLDQGQGKVKDYGFELMGKIDTNDNYLLNEIVDYHLDEVVTILMVIYALILNLFYNYSKKYKFMTEWFMLLSIFYVMRICGMAVTIFPAPWDNKDLDKVCDKDYNNFGNGGNIMLDAIKVYIYRDRVCYDFVFDADVINITLLGLLIMRDFSMWSVKVKIIFLWVLELFIVMIMRTTYTVNIYLSVLVTVLMYLVFHYETTFRTGWFGKMLAEEVSSMIEDQTEEQIMIDSGEEKVDDGKVDVNVISDEYENKNNVSDEYNNEIR